jgi:hypothetical protein
MSSSSTELYSQIKIGTGTSDTAAFKSDATFFTIADGIVQHMFITYLFAGNKFHEIVGEVSQYYHVRMRALSNWCVN